jgi:PST family polysaccharide transporter
LAAERRRAESGVSEGGANVERRFRVSLKWAFVMGSGQRIVGLGSTFALAAILGPRAFGLVSMAMVFILLVQVFLEQGISTALIQREKLEREHLDSAFWMTIGWCILLAGAAVGLSEWWASVNGEPELVPVIRVLAVLVPIQGLTIVQQALLQRNMRFKKLAFRSTLAAVVGAAAGLTLAITGFGVWSLVVQEIVTASAGLVLLWAVSGWLPRARFSVRHARDLLGFSVHAFLGNLGSFVNRRSDALLLGVFFGPTVVGLYRLADRLVEGLLSVSTRPVQQVSLPHFSRLQSDRPALQKAVASCMRITSLTTVPPMLVVVACAAFIMPVLGPDWVPAADALKLLALVGVAKAIILFTGPLLYAVSKPQVRTIMVWTLAIASAASFAVVGVALSDQPVTEQVLGSAATRAILFVILFIPVNLAIVARFTGVRVASLIPHFVVPTGAGLGAVAAVAGLESASVLDALPAGAALAAAAAVAITVAATIVLLFDRGLRARVMRLGRAISGRATPIEGSVGGHA